MKKILITFFISILLYNSTFANDTSCFSAPRIPAIELQTYQKNLNKTISNISKQLQSGTSDTSTYSKNKGQISYLAQDLLNWKGYTSLFKYYVTFPLSAEIPYTIKREYSNLERQRNRLQEFSYRLVSKGQADITLKGVCENISGRCTYDSIELYSYLRSILSNHETIMNTFRKTVIGEYTTVENIPNDISYVGENFSSEMISSFGGDAIIKQGKQCGFFKRAGEIISKIELINDQGETGIALWKEQINRIQRLGKQSSEDKYEEKQILREELSRQGVSSSQQESMLQALDQFNSNGGYSASNNFIENSLNYFVTNIKREFSSFYDTTQKSFENQPENLPHQTILHIQSESDTDTDLEYRIKQIYKTQIPNSVQENAKQSQIQSMIFQIYDMLSKSNAKLKQAIPIARLACDETNPGAGRCGQ